MKFSKRHPNTFLQTLNLSNSNQLVLPLGARINFCCIFLKQHQIGVLYTAITLLSEYPVWILSWQLLVVVLCHQMLKTGCSSFIKRTSYSLQFCHILFDAICLCQVIQCHWRSYKTCTRNNFERINSKPKEQISLKDSSRSCVFTKLLLDAAPLKLWRWGVCTTSLHSYRPQETSTRVKLKWKLIDFESSYWRILLSTQLWKEFWEVKQIMWTSV